MSTTPDPTAAPDPLVRLMEHVAKLKGLQYWILHMTPTEKWASPTPGEVPDPATISAFADHLDWLAEQERNGTLFLSGTVDQEHGVGPGMAIIRAASRVEAEAIAATEPFHQLGLRANTIKSWTVNEGSVKLSINLFENTIEMS
jgi:uncharacterized protein YciI